MKTDFVVPKALQTLAADALGTARRSTLPGVSGVSVAQALVTGRVTLDIVRRMRRFFTVNERDYGLAVRGMMTVANSAIMLSWNLYGGESGRAWSELVHAEAQHRGEVDPDPWLELLTASSDEVTARLNLGAWRWEYGMTPERAARFYEEYHRTNSVVLDLRRVFGDGASAVIQAVHRRGLKPNRFAKAAKLLASKTYAQAAKKDLLYLKAAIGNPPGLPLEEMIAMFVVANRARGALYESVETPTIPKYGGPAASALSYCDPISYYVAYMHPSGLLTERAGLGSPLSVRMARQLQDAERGAVDTATAQSLLEEIATVLGRAGHLGGFGHVLIEAWRRRDWEVIASELPLDAPFRSPFLQVTSAS